MTSPIKAFSKHRVDIAACLVLAALCFVYLMLRRWPLGSSDEAYYFYHAIRMLQGEAPYLDFVELTTPFYIDLLALAFHVFGESFTVGRAVGSAVQSLIVVVIYVGAIAVGAGRLLAVGAAMIHLAVAQSTWPYSTPHWLAILLLCALLLSALDRQRALTARRICLQGLLLGVLVATRQHAGAAVAAGMTLIFCFDAMNNRSRGRVEGMTAFNGFLLLTFTSFIVFVCIMAPHVMRSGYDPLIAQLISHPLTEYRNTNQATWGQVFAGTQQGYTWTFVIRYLPLVLIITGLRAALAVVRQADRQTSEKLVVLTIFGTAAIVYTMSFPDLIHIAMILPVVLILSMELLGSTLHAFGRWEKSMKIAFGVLLIFACGIKMHSNYVNAADQHPISHVTPFGKLPFTKEEEVATIEFLQSYIEQDPGRVLFAYPGWPAIYLLTGANNPTRHEIIFPGYQTDSEIKLLVETLEKKRVKYVLLLRFYWRGGDVVDNYVQQHFNCNDDPVLQFCIRKDGERAQL